MPLVVEDGTGLAGANSYVSVAEADAYHSELGNASWAAAATATKEAALIQATRYLDGHYRPRWRGSRSQQAQALEWPRFQAWDDNGFPLAGIPADLKQATHELALRALDGALNADQDRGGQVQRTVVGPIEIEYAPGAPAGVQYRQVDELLGRLLRAAGVKVSRV